MKIGETIRKYRKEKELTQEQLAKLLGVTASAVNKWERGGACPDIALLAPIARALGISLDMLLAYHESLSQEEINNLLNELKERMKRESYHEVFGWMQDKIHTFPNSESLIVQAAVALNAYRMMKEIPDKEQYDEQILGWLERGLANEDEKLRIMAADALYSFYLNRQEYERAEAYLQYFSLQDPEKRYRQAMIYAKTGQTKKARPAYEELLYDMQNKVMMTLRGIYALDMQEKDFARAHYMADKIEQFEKCFEMGRYYEVSHRIDLAVAEQDGEACIRLAEEMLANVRDIFSFTKAPLYQHMSFREIDEEYGDMMYQMLIQSFRDEETFRFIEHDERWRRLKELYSFNRKFVLEGTNSHVEKGAWS